MQVPGVTYKELRTLIEDIRKFMRKYLNVFETNQQVIVMKYLFRGFSMEAWKGIEFSRNKHTCYNKIVNQNCMNYYYKYWKDRNEKLHDEIVQRKIIIEWQQNKHTRSLEG